MINHINSLTAVARTAAAGSRDLDLFAARFLFYIRCFCKRRL